MRKKQKRVCAMFLSTSLAIMHICADPTTVLANELGVSSFEELQNVIMEADDGDTVRISTKSSLEILDTILIDKDITITGGTLTRVDDIPIFEVSGDLTLENVTLKGTQEKKTNTKSPIICEGNLTLDDKSKITNFVARRGGGLYVADGGYVVINQGSKIANNEVHAIDRYNLNDSAVGGGIFIDSGGSVTLEGGIIDGNKATVEDTYDQVAIGGGVAIKEGGSFVMNDGYITNNSVNGFYGTAEGGGIAAGSDHYLPAFEGLGTVSSADIQLNAGTIASNKAVRGGGIYYHSGDTLYLEDAAITNNEAKYGGGIWYCQVGYGQLGNTLLLTNNKAKLGNDVYSANPYGMFDGYDYAFEMSLADNVYPGREVTWYDDYNNSKITDINRYLYGYALIWYWGVADDFLVWNEENADLNFPTDREWEDMALTAKVGADGGSHALQIKNNVAEREGGGIACNGRLEAPDRELPPPPPATPSEPDEPTPPATPSEAETTTHEETSSSEEETTSSIEETTATEEETPTTTEEETTTVTEEETTITEEETTAPLETEPETPPPTPLRPIPEPEPELPSPITPPPTPPAPVVEFFPDEEVPLGSFETFVDEEVPLVPWEAPRTSDRNAVGMSLSVMALLMSLASIGIAVKHKDD